MDGWMSWSNSSSSACTRLQSQQIAFHVCSAKTDAAIIQFVQVVMSPDDVLWTPLSGGRQLFTPSDDSMNRFLAMSSSWSGPHAMESFSA
jgi:hypothetical protein